MNPTGYSSNTAMIATWLKSDLAATAQEWIIVYFHHPPYTHGSHNSDSESDLISIRTNWVPILEAYGVDLVLSGHSHVYERTMLINGHYGVAAPSTPTPWRLIRAMAVPMGWRLCYQGHAAGQGVVYSVCGCSGQSGHLHSIRRWWRFPVWPRPARCSSM